MRMVIVAALVGCLVAGGITLARTPRAQGMVRVLLLSQTSNTNDNPSIEYQTESIIRLVESGDFFTQVAARNPQDVAASFPSDARERRVAWRAAVFARDEGHGLLQVFVADRDPERASRLSQAVADALEVRIPDYTAGRLKMMTVDAPEIIRWPNWSALPQPMIIGGLVGAGCGYAFYLLGTKKKAA